MSVGTHERTNRVKLVFAGHANYSKKLTTRTRNKEV